jgi:ABC-type sugar transport system ATPase subunit
MELLGEPYAPMSVNDARRHGVEIVLRERGLVPSLTVAENFMLGRHAGDSRFGVLIPGRTTGAVKGALAEIASDVAPTTMGSQLSLEDQKLVELARAIHFKPKVLLVDEMSACLSHMKLDVLFATMRRLRDSGVAIVYISHHLDEIRGLCDRIAVLKDGHLVGVLPGDTDETRLTTLMVGRAPTSVYRDDFKANTGGAERLKVTNLSLPGAYTDVSFAVHAGEILGIGGLAGCGSEQLARSLFGDVRPQSGSMTLLGAPYAPTSPREAIRRGVSYVPPDRDREGVILRARVAHNITLATLGDRAVMGVYPGAEDDPISQRMISHLDIRCQGPQDFPFNLSGGNRQKMVLAKWLVRPPLVMVLHNPTRGVDVGAKSEIYGVVRRMTEDGTAVVLVSDDLPELLGMSDRILILRRGAVTLESIREDRPTEELIVSYMI